MYLNLDSLKLKREFELEKRITWEEIAHETKIRRPTLYSYKNVDPAKRAKAFNVEHLIALREYFNCSANELIAWEA